MMRRSILLVPFVAGLILLGAGCTSVTTLQTPNVTYQAINSGGTLRLTWAAITDAKNYEIKTDGYDSTVASTVTTFDVTAPTTSISVYAVSGSDKSDPATIDCKVVETSSLVLYGISDSSATDPSGLAFTSDGTASALSLADANKSSLDFVYDDTLTEVLPQGMVNAGDFGWASNTKLNTMMDAGTTNYDSLTEAASTGYASKLTIAVNGVYALWLSSSTTWSTNDHFCKAKVVSIDNGAYKKVTLTVAYQKIGGLRWLE